MRGRRRGVDALDDDVREGGCGADFVGVGLGRDHHFEVDLAAFALVVFRVDDRFVGGGCFGGVLSLAAGGRDVYAAFREGILQHL